MSWLWLGLALPATGQLSVDATTGLRLERGGDALTQDRIAGRNAARWSPRLLWSEQIGASGSADVVVNPVIDLPPRRSGQAVSRLSGSGRLRLRRGDALYALRGSAQRVAFPDGRYWDGRRRLHIEATLDRRLRRGLSLQGALGTAHSTYGPQNERRDLQHQLRTGILAYRSRTWASAAITGKANDSTRPGYDYRAAALSIGAGTTRAGFRMSLRALREQRWVTGTRDWGLTWASARVERTVSSTVSVFVNAQRETAALYTPWQLLETGLVFELPVGLGPTPSTHRRPMSLAPAHQDSVWVFRFPDVPARSVHLVGSFSGWDINAHPMERVGSGWVTSVQLPAGVHQYAFVIDDGDWQTPPEAPRYVEDGFGRRNGVLQIGLKP